MEEKILLKSGKSYLHNKTGSVCRVLSGKVYVYVVTLNEEVPGRRMFLCESRDDWEIPAYSYEKDGRTQCFLLSPDENAELELFTPGEEENARIKNEFLRRAQAPLGEDSYEECVNEKAERVRMQEETAFFNMSRERKNAEKRSFSLIYRLFQGETGYEEETKSELYNAMRFLCGKMRINIVPYHSLVSVCGYSFTAEDIARLSHFAIREVTLEEGWHHADGGALLVFTQKQNKPVVCLPRSRGSYTAYAEGKQLGRVHAEEAAAYSAKALMIYEPFPNKPLKAKDLASFALHHLYAGDVAVYFMLTFLGALIGLLVPFLNQIIFDRFIPMGNRPALLQLCSVMLTCAMGNLAFMVVKNLAMLRGTRSMEYALQAAAFDRLFHLPQEFFERFSSADLVGRVMGVSQIFRVVSGTVVTTALGALFSLLYLARMFHYSSKLAWTAVLLLLLTMAVMALLGTLKIRHERTRIQTETDAATMLYQFLGGVQKIRLSGIENQALYEYLRPYTASREADMKTGRVQNGASVFSSASSIVFSMVIYYVMIKNDMEISIGSYIAFSSAFGMFSAAMLQLVNCYLDVNMVIPSYHRVQPVLQETKELVEGAVMPKDIRGNIEVNNLFFSYEKDGPEVLKDISFEIDQGEYVGIVGASGCGKSTLLKCLLGFAEPTNGKIYYDGQDIEMLDKRELRKHFGVVLQDGKLIGGSIAENIAIANPQINRERIKEIIADVGLEQDVRRMPMGLETMLSENTGTISGGQMQRILIGRALANDPAILFFDEATSALDNVTQTLICQNLEKLNITRVVIAHRLSTIEKCDRIFVMRDGEIVESGNYGELISKHGLFYELSLRQTV